MSTKNYLKEDIEKLKTLRDDKRKELVSLKFKIVNNSLKETSDIGKAKREIARINTIIRQKENTTNEQS